MLVYLENTKTAKWKKNNPSFLLIFWKVKKKQTKKKKKQLRFGNICGNGAFTFKLPLLIYMLQNPTLQLYGNLKANLRTLNGDRMAATGQR